MMIFYRKRRSWKNLRYQPSEDSLLICGRGGYNRTGNILMVIVGRDTSSLDYSRLF
jgi:hypothetical protein